MREVSFVKVPVRFVCISCARSVVIKVEERAHTMEGIRQENVEAIEILKRRGWIVTPPPTPYFICPRCK